MIRNKINRKNIVSSDDNIYWASFSDLMSALLVIFILAAVALIIELTQKTDDVKAGIEELKRAELARKNIIHEVRDELAKQHIRVEIADNETVVRIPETTLSFHSGDDKIPKDEAIQQTVLRIGEVLQLAILKENRYRHLDTVFVEGHTDSDGIFYNGKGNWGLSADRAISIWNAWEKDLTIAPSLSQLYNSYGQKLFSVSGYAATRRVSEIEDTDEQKRKNRRIDIRFTVKRPKITKLENVIHATKE